MTSVPTEGERLVGGRYELAGELGRGGMGVVWLANDRVLHREVALKEITYPVHLTDDERAVLRERTLREARAAARLEDPHVVAIHDVVEEDGRPWLVMEHVRSRSLQRILEEDGPLTPVQTARIGLDVLSAIEVAHAAGIVHRDVKPANVLVADDGHACLTDFGIATTTNGDATLSAPGAVLGSPSYMAPERAQGEPPTPAVDLWSLGATLYTAVEGRTPFDRAESMAILLAVVGEDPAPMRAAGPLAPVLLGLLTKDPAQRLTAAEARRQLTAVAEGAQPAGAAEPERARKTPRVVRGGDVQRFDLSELLALASTSKAAISTVVREVSERRHQPPMNRRERRAAAKQRRFRFKRRWVVVPTVLLVLLVLLVLGALALLVTGAIELS
ncbi:serine/threonine-protein kinase [Modestobacter versicolor]|uniref:non-specific serine/threonine protein kinase n=1 Tax=Modestobacter versicolor TaxID=429133 RepID=A0A323VDY8_9ACTN|nr:serine/threonine-protein kinase [Modestobacter versicolor]MBB3675828.1 serine/threonine protein kinase [Modestobacter versicolor]PZA22855.1 serine/threonine protein kinase [Modestobacter versicolor]